MSDSIQSLMEELGRLTVLQWLGEQWECCAGSSNVCAMGDTPIEALTRLRDKVKPRTPEQVVEEFRSRCSAKEPDECVPCKHQVAAIVAALRDADMLKEPGA